MNTELIEKQRAIVNAQKELQSFTNSELESLVADFKGKKAFLKDSTKKAKAFELACDEVTKKIKEAFQNKLNSSKISIHYILISKNQEFSTSISCDVKFSFRLENGAWCYFSIGNYFAELDRETKSFIESFVEQKEMEELPSIQEVLNMKKKLKEAEELVFSLTCAIPYWAK